MRAPRWFRDFCAWRWAPSVALIAGALLFIALVLLLIPQQVDTAARPGDAARTPAMLGAPSSPRAVLDTPPENAVAVGHPKAERAAAPAPAATPAPESEPTAVTPPNYQSNIAARADRPARPTLRSSP